MERDTFVSGVCCSRKIIFTVASRKKMLSSVITPTRFCVCCVVTHYVDFYSALPGVPFCLARACRSAIKMMSPLLWNRNACRCYRLCENAKKVLIANQEVHEIYLFLGGHLWAHVTPPCVTSANFRRRRDKHELLMSKLKKRFGKLFGAHFSTVVSGHYSGANASPENLVSPP